MTITRALLSFSLAAVALIACFAPRAPTQAASLSAREILVLAQQTSGANYTYDRATAEALASAQVARPDAAASRAALESLLGEAGFSLRPVGPPDRNVWLVERAGG